MSEIAELKINGETLELPIIIGSEGEKAVDIGKLRATTGYITFDPSFGNTGSCTSDITFIDGAKGILSHRGIPVEELAAKSNFIETAHLLLKGKIGTKEELSEFREKLSKHALIHEDMRHFFDGFPRGAHPMNILSTMINALAAFYPDVDSLSSDEEIDETAARLISIVRTMAAFAYKKSIGEPTVNPRGDLSFVGNFLNMMFDTPVKPYVVDKDVEKILDQLFILHADHEQNCSTSTVRVVGSAQVNLYATISAGISALSGPLHGGANQAVIAMLESIHEGGESIDKVIARAKDKQDSFRLMGFGHRVYKTIDPRAKIIKKACYEVLDKLNVNDPLLDIARELEEKAMKDDYFTSRNLYPNVDFYSGIIYRAIGIPEDMMTVMFAIGRFPGWIAQWKEMINTKGGKITRPRQIYTGNNYTSYEDSI